MPLIFGLIVVLIIVLAVMLGSLYLDSQRPFYRLVKSGNKYIIQYRKVMVLWRTYTLTNGEAAVYYVQTEAEAMIKTLVERRKTTKSLDRLGRRGVEIIEYSDSGQMMRKK